VAWRRLLDLYQPLIRGYLRRQQLAEQDVDDVTQEVLTLVVRKIDGFQRQDQTGSFRSWLRKITLNCLRDHWRSRRGKARADGSSRMLEVLEQLADPESGLSQLWDQEHDRHVTQYLCRQIQQHFTEKTYQAFLRVAMQEEDAEQVAADLGMTVNAVYVARSRVLAKLREYGQGLLD
jgi:RNA polymerase sigma-70 factor (ECF subfamily)